MAFQENIPDDILKQYMEEGSDFGFSTVDQNELGSILNPSTDSEEITAIKAKLDQIIEMNSTCEGAIAVKAQYDELMKARLLELEKNIVPLLLNLKKNKEKDYIYWPGAQRIAQCDLQINKIINLTRNGLK
jgi:hypothetical protein